MAVTGTNMTSKIAFVLMALGGAVCAAEEFSWDGTSPDSEFKFSEKRIEVEPGSIVRFDIGWTKKEWNFGSAAHIQIKWDNESGKQLAITALDSTATAIPKVHNYPCVESAALSALDRPIPVRAYLKVPAKAKYATVGFLFSGNASRLTLDEAKVSPVDASKKPWERRKPPKRMIKFGPDPYTDAEVAAALKSRPRAFPKIVREGDRVELEVNGERIFPGIRHAGRRDTPRGVREFSKIGFRIFNVNLYVGKTTYTKEPQQIAAGQILKEDGSYDIPLMEQRVYDILRQDTNAYVILVIRVVEPNLNIDRLTRSCINVIIRSYRVICVKVIIAISKIFVKRSSKLTIASCAHHSIRHHHGTGNKCFGQSVSL